MSDTLTNPQSRAEEFLGAIVGQSGVTAPSTVESRMEVYLKYMLDNGTAREAEIRTIVDALKGGMTYKGSVATVADLPVAATSNKGHVYTIVATGHEHVSDGTQWIDLSAELADVYTKTQADNKFQDKLVSGTNIKSVNGTSLLGSGDVTIDGAKAFIATYNVTTASEIAAAVTAGKAIFCKYTNGGVTHQLMLVDESESKYGFAEARVGTNDGITSVSGITIALAKQDNTWEVLTGSSSIPTKLSDLTNDSAVQFTSQSLTTEQKIQALKNLDGIRTVPLTDGTETLAQIAARLTTINSTGEHVFFDVATLNYPLYLCTIAIKYENSTPKSYRLNDLVSGSMSMGSYEANKTLATILSEAVNAYYSMVVTVTASDGATVTGQTVTVRKGQTATSPVYATKAYNGQPVTFVLPDGFDYYVETSNTFAQHFNPTTANGRMSADMAVTLTYSSLSTISTFPDLKGALDIGAVAGLTVGQEVSFTHSTEGTLTYEIDHIDATNETVHLVQTTTLNAQKQFDAPEALYKPTATMVAGDYSFIHSGTTYYFTLTQDIPADGHLRATPTNFYTYSSASNTTAIETGTVSTTEIAGATSIGTTASGNLNHMDRVNYGSNDAGESGLMQWLMGTGTGWWEPKTMFDRPPAYVGETGFLTGVPSEVLNCIDTATISVGTNTTYCAPDSAHTKGTAYTMQAKFYLASQKELFGVQDVPDTSFQFQKFIDGGNDSRIRRYGSSARHWWLRSPNSYALSVRLVHTDGTTNSSSAYNTLGVVPACQMSRTQS